MTTTTSTIVAFSLDTPVGALRGAAVDERLVATGFEDHWERLADDLRGRFPDAEWTEGTSRPAVALAAYLDGDLSAIDGVEVDADGSEFRRRVWDALRRIPVGETWSYAELASAVGNPGAVRAVGTANGANPVSVVVPCHRVVRSDGTLGGYGGGLDRKAWLLSHEGARLA